MTFSTRVPADLRPNGLAVAVERERAAGRRLIDLTQSNPTCVGFPYPSDLLAGLADPRALSYAPAPFGTVEAREAVAADFARRGFSVPPDCVALTASTSEAYSLLFKVLCQPADEVLVPRPSYPLFDHLARLEGVVAIPYDLEYHGAWRIDRRGLEAGLTDRTRALLLVSPNNPTGSFVTPEELDLVASLCQAMGMAIVADEVFADYELQPGAAAAAARFMDRRDVLTFSLGGLSKSVGLPQVKLSWVATAGPPPLVHEALARLELACDTYLSVSTPVQMALPGLLDRGETIRRAIRRRIARNLEALDERIARVPECNLLRTEGGWSAIVRVPAVLPEEELVLRLVREEGVLAHPGYFFDFQSESYLVVSLLVPTAEFDEGIRRLLRQAVVG